KAIIEDISQPSTSATKENKSNKLLLLLTWHDSTPAKDSVCDSVTPRCMPHGLLTPPTNESVITYTQLSSVQGLDTQDHVIDDVMRRLSFNEIELDGEAGFGDVADRHVDVEPTIDVGRTEKYVVEQVRVDEVVHGSGEESVVHGSGEEVSSEDASTDDNDVEDDDILVD
ncbi:hypothetical protein Tco_1365114, partial [Tanacetum coccineum]